MTFGGCRFTVEIGKRNSYFTGDLRLFQLSCGRWSLWTPMGASVHRDPHVLVSRARARAQRAAAALGVG